MSYSLNSIMMFAIAKNGRTVHIDEVLNGAKCECICPACHSPLIAKNEGVERAHHFAHDGRMEEHSCSETALHYAAKQIVADYKMILLPGATILSNQGGAIIEFNNVILEHRLETDTDGGQHIVADCLGIYGSESIIIEIAVHHQVDLVKSQKIQMLDIPSIEISLTDFADQAWDWKNLTQEVLFSAQRRKWIWQPEPPQAEPAITNSLNDQVLRSDQKEWVFDIGGRWVWVKKLPYANIKVFHAPNSYLRSIVEPLCRNKGYWQSKYKCWVVFDQFKDDILKRLTEAGRLMEFQSTHPSSEI